MSFQNSETSPYPTVNLSQFGDALNRYAGDKQGHVTQVLKFLFLNQIS